MTRNNQHDRDGKTKRVLDHPCGTCDGKGDHLKMTDERNADGTVKTITVICGHCGGSGREPKR